MRLTWVALAAIASATVGPARAAPAVDVRDAVARMVVIPEDRADVRVEVARANPRLPLKVRTQGQRVIVEGGLGRRITACRGKGAAASVQVRGVGLIGYEDMPQLVVRTPRQAQVSATGAVFGAAGRSSRLVLNAAGCGDWTVADVAGDMQVNQAGTGDTHTGRAGSAALKLAGSGNVATAEILGGLSVNIAGAGDVSARSVNGPLSVWVAGSGDVIVAGGRATAMTVTVAGSGNVEFRGVADSLKARIAGSGDVRAREVRGPVSKAIMGPGRLTVG